jgi:sodium-dependent dicarboxylate transporter 2/3/5
MRRVVGAILGPVLAGAIALPDLPVGAAAHRLAAVAVLTVVWWITEPIPIPVTALVASVLCVLLGVAPAADVFAPYADPVIFLFLGAFLVAEAITTTGLDARLARSVLALAGVGSSPARVMIAVGLLTALLSMWMSNTAAAALMMPLALSAIRGQDPSRRSWAVLAVAYAASLGGIATPVGTPPNLIALGYLDREAHVRLDFLDWARYGLPLSLGLTALLLVAAGLATRRVPPATSGGKPEREPWTRAQLTVALVFGLLVAAWLLPGLVSLGWPGAGKALGQRAPESVVALLGAALLFALPAQVRPWKPVLEWSRSAHVDWGTILLFGGGLSLGSLMSRTGLGATIGESIAAGLGVHTSLGLVALSCGTAILLTEIMSNTAAANVVVPVVYAMARELGVDPVGPVVAAALGSSMAFVLPISTPPNAIAYGTGHVTIPQMIRRGALLDVIAFVAIVAWVGLVG